MKEMNIFARHCRWTQELWESCCVFIAWTSVSMDSCIPFASAYLIPLTLPSYTQTFPSVYSVTLYLALCGDWQLINMLYRNGYLIFFLPSFTLISLVVICTVPMEWRGTHALSMTYKLHNLKWRHAVLLPNENVLPLIIKAHPRIDTVTCRLFFYTRYLKAFLFSLCLCRVNDNAALPLL